MPYTPPPEQTVKRLRIFARVMLALTILGILISLPFIMAGGLGLIGTVPLSLFLIAHIRYQRALRLEKRLSKAMYYFYMTSALLSGLASAFGFYMFGQLDGLDQETAPFFPYVFLAVIITPLITYFTIRASYLWNKRFDQDVPASL